MRTFIVAIRHIDGVHVCSVKVFATSKSEALTGAVDKFVAGRAVPPGVYRPSVAHPLLAT